MSYSSRIIEDAVEAISRLPGIGKKSALRMVLHLVKQKEYDVTHLTTTIQKIKTDLKYCNTCFNLSDHEMCDICSNTSRKSELICVVENVRDVIAIEETAQFHGKYHVLGGVISPIEGIGADDLRIHELMERVDKDGVREVILGISPTIEGDTTIFYIARKLEAKEVRVSMLSRGVAFGGELEYTDGLTLGRSLVERIPYNTLS